MERENIPSDSHVDEVQEKDSDSQIEKEILDNLIQCVCKSQLDPCINSSDTVVYGCSSSSNVVDPSDSHVEEVQEKDSDSQIEKEILDNLIRSVCESQLDPCISSSDNVSQRKESTEGQCILTFTGNDRRGSTLPHLVDYWTSSDSDSSDETDSSSSSSEAAAAAASSSDETESEVEVLNSDTKKKNTTKSGQYRVKTYGELSIEDLPPIEDLHISVPENEIQQIGTISSIVGHLLVIQSFKNTPALDLDSILFLEGGKPLGQIFDVFGQVVEPLYAVRFNSEEELENKGVKVGASVYWAPERIDVTKYVFVDQLKRIKGSDASWEHNNEPPEEAIEYSDDEEEKLAKQKRKEKLPSNQSSADRSSGQNYGKRNWHPKKAAFFRSSDGPIIHPAKFNATVSSSGYFPRPSSMQNDAFYDRPVGPPPLAPRWDYSLSPRFGSLPPPSSYGAMPDAHLPPLNFVPNAARPPFSPLFGSTRPPLLSAPNFGTVAPPTNVTVPGGFMSPASVCAFNIPRTVQSPSNTSVNSQNVNFLFNLAPPPPPPPLP